jgi:hypothetical protein
LSPDQPFADEVSHLEKWEQWQDNIDCNDKDNVDNVNDNEDAIDVNEDANNINENDEDHINNVKRTSQQ